MYKFILLILLSGCSSYMASMQQEKRTDVALDAMRLEIADLKHLLNGTQIELHIVEEKLKKQEVVLSGYKQPPHKIEPLLQQLAFIEKEIGQLKLQQEQTRQSFETMRSHANATGQTLESLAQEVYQQNKKFEEITKLKSTLSSLSQSLVSKDSTHVKTYRVKSGDTLKKIAEMHNTTILELKKINQLELDRIIIGQELKIP